MARRGYAPRQDEPIRNRAGREPNLPVRARRFRHGFGVPAPALAVSPVSRARGGKIVYRDPRRVGTDRKYRFTAFASATHGGLRIRPMLEPSAGTDSAPSPLNALSLHIVVCRACACRATTRVRVGFRWSKRDATRALLSRSGAGESTQASPCRDPRCPPGGPYWVNRLRTSPDCTFLDRNGRL